MNDFLIGALGLGVLMIPFARAMFPSPTDDELRHVEPPVMTARAVVRMRTVRRSVSGYEGSVSQMVVRGTRPARQAVSGALRGARHAARVVWERPSAYVRRHARRGRRYYETLSTVVEQRNFLGD